MKKCRVQEESDDEDNNKKSNNKKQSFGEDLPCSFPGKIYYFYLTE